MSSNIIDTIYPQAEIYIVEYSFADKQLAIDVTCRVPKGTYTSIPIPYVTAENYVRCLSQACYLLAERVLEKKIVSLDVEVEKFRKAATNYDLYYRSLSMTFHKLIERETNFRMRFSLINWKEIRRIQDFIIFTFANQRTVISGEMSFVFIT